MLDMSLPLDQRLDALLPALLDEHKVPGAAVAVIEGGTTLVRGYGLRHAEEAEPVGPETVFEAASLGKPLFAYAVMKRVLAGEIDLDRPLAGELDAPFAEEGEWLGRITARHVLSHSTGFPNWRPNRFTSEPEPLRVEREPGRRFGYSGEGYMYLQAVMARRGGEPLDRFMQASVFDPLGLVSTSYRWSDRFEADFATPHGPLGEAGDKWRAREPGSAYSLHSTAADLALFLEAMLAEEDETAAAMLVPQTEISDSLAWSLGWGIERRPEGNWFWQWGDNSGFKHFVFGSRGEGRAVLVLTNARLGTHVYRAVAENVLSFLPAALDFEMIRY